MAWNEDDLQWKMTSKLEYISNHWSDLPQILNLPNPLPNQIEYCLKWNRPPMEDHIKIIKRGISQPSMIRSSSNFKLKLGVLNQNWKWLKWRRPPMEDDLQWKTASNERRPPMKDNLQWKTTSNGRQPPMEDVLQWKTTFNGRQPPMEDDLQWKTTSNGRQPPIEDNIQ
jgi:hypothetical protein